MLLLQAGISCKIASWISLKHQINVHNSFHALQSLRIWRYICVLVVSTNECFLPLYGIEWNTRQVFIRNVHWKVVNFQIWVCLECFLLYGVMRWLEASTCLVFFYENQFWCWMQEIVLLAHEILFCMTQLHASLNLQVNCFLHY